MNNTPKISNLEKIERIENAVIAIADIVSQDLMHLIERGDDIEIPAHKLPGVLLDTLTLWEKLDKIKTSEQKRNEVSKPVITGSLSGVPTHVLLSYLEIENSEDLLSFMRPAYNTVPEVQNEQDDSDTAS